MSDDKSNNDKNEGYVPLEKGYKPSCGQVTGGHKPEKSELNPTNPPKSK